MTHVITDRDFEKKGIYDREKNKIRDRKIKSPQKIVKKKPHDTEKNKYHDRNKNKYYDDKEYDDYNDEEYEEYDDEHDDYDDEEYVDYDGKKDKCHKRKKHKCHKKKKHCCKCKKCKPICIPICKPICDRSKKTLLKCGVPGDMFEFTATGQTATVANISIDTENFKNPIAKLQFSSQVEATLEPVSDPINPSNAEIRLLYELVCRTSVGSPTMIGTWNFSRFLSGPILGDDATAQTLRTTDTFSFDACVSPPLRGIVDYFVRVTATTVSTVDGENNASAIVSKGQLIAIIQDSH